MSKLNVFIKDTFSKIVKSASFIIMLLSPLVLIGIIVAIGYFAEANFEGIPEVNLAVISEDTTIIQTIDQADESISIIEDARSEEQAKAALGDGTVDGYLVANWTNDEIEAAFTYDGSLENHIPLLEQALTGLQLARRSQALNLTNEQVQSLNEPVLLQTNIVSIDDGELIEEDDFTNVIAIGSAYFINIIIMMFIMFYASTVIEEIAREKGTRMMEVILSSTTATTHFFGKIIGVFSVMVLHVAVYIIAAIGAFLYFKDHAFLQALLGQLDIGQIIIEFIQFSAGFLVLGVLMYMFLAAFLGSLITKTEDIGRASGPLTILVLLGFYIGLFAMASPENIIVVVASYIPFLTPFVMPFRIATNTVSDLQVWLAFGGATLFTGFIAFISLAFYRANVLIYSDSSLLNTIKQSWTLLRSEKNSLA